MINHILFSEKKYKIRVIFKSVKIIKLKINLQKI